MTQEVLVQLLLVLCSAPMAQSTVFVDRTNVALEHRLQCSEKYLNCAVKSDGTIMTINEFRKGCMK